MLQPISITAIASISPLGFSMDEIWNNYTHSRHLFEKRTFDEIDEWVAPLSMEAAQEIKKLRQSDSKYKKLDDTVLFAIYASRLAKKNANWEASSNFGINIGSSRGATALFEKYYQEFLTSHQSSTLSSPTTTLGNISSWVAHDLQTSGPEISHSITCSTASHALLNGVAWINSGMTDKFLVGGSEAPLTPFTIAQMKAMKIYAKPELSIRAESRSNNPKEVTERSRTYPCQALNLNKQQNTMVLGEGAAVACLEKGVQSNALAIIEGVGYATEILEHSTSISSDAKCFQRSMKMALGDLCPDEVDAIVMHAPGTIKGDSSEFEAIKKVFCNKTPFLTSNKWKVGHTFGTSGMLSIEMAILMLQKQKFIEVPFIKNNSVQKKINRVLANSVGFGGNAVSILLKIPN